MAEEKLNMTALLALDMQKDFILTSSPVHLKGGEAIVPNVIKTVEVARKSNIPYCLAKMAENKLNMTTLLELDMQKDFILTSSPLHLKGGEAIVPNVIKTVEVARKSNIPYCLWKINMGRDVELFRRHLYCLGGKPPKPASKGSVGAELVDGLVIEEGDYKLVKTRFSAFFNTHLHSYLQAVGVFYLLIIGVQTPNCIRQTAFDAIALDYQVVTVIVDATAAATPDIHAANIVDMRNVGVATPTLEEWCNSLI